MNENQQNENHDGKLVLQCEPARDTVTRTDESIAPKASICNFSDEIINNSTLFPTHVPGI